MVEKPPNPQQMRFVVIRESDLIVLSLYNQSLPTSNSDKPKPFVFNISMILDDSQTNFESSVILNNGFVLTYLKKIISIDNEEDDGKNEKDDYTNFIKFLQKIQILLNAEINLEIYHLRENVILPSADTIEIQKI